MKKYIFLFSATLLIVASLFYVTSVIRGIPLVTVQRLTERDTEITVQCSGKIEESAIAEVTTQIPLVAKNVYVKAGERVKKGETIARVDTQKTIELLEKKYAGVLQTLPAAGVWSESVLEALSNNRDLIPRTIASPVNGTVMQLNLSKDGLSDVEQPIVMISTGGNRFVRLQIKESEIASISEGQLVRISGESFERIYQGTVTSIADSAVPNNGEATIEVIVTALDADEFFRPGVTVKAEIIVDTVTEAVIVPYELVRIDEDCKEYVMIYENHRAQKRAIAVQQDTAEGYLIQEGVDADDFLIIGDVPFSHGAFVYVAEVVNK